MLKTLLKAATAAAALALAAGAATAADVTIRYSSWVPPGHWYLEKALKPYLAEIEQVTEGRVKIDILPKVVGTPAAQFDVVRDGLADMSWIVLGYTPGRFKLAQFGELPFNAITKPEHARIYYDTYVKHFGDLNEFKGVELLGLWNITAINIATKTREVASLADMKGLKLRVASDYAAKSLELLGGVPIVKSSTEAFEMLASGAIDGSLMLGETPQSTNSIDLMDHYTIVPGGLATALHAMIINPDTWARISEQDQAAIRAISGSVMVPKVAGIYLDQDATGIKAMEDAGYKIQTASDAFVAELQQKLAPIEDLWIEEARKAGAEDPRAVLDEYRAAVAAAE